MKQLFVSHKSELHLAYAWLCWPTDEISRIRKYKSYWKTIFTSFRVFCCLSQKYELCFPYAWLRWPTNEILRIRKYKSCRKTMFTSFGTFLSTIFKHLNFDFCLKFMSGHVCMPPCVHSWRHDLIYVRFPISRNLGCQTA